MKTKYYVAVSADFENDHIQPIYGVGTSVEAAIADAIKQAGYADEAQFLSSKDDPEAVLGDFFQALPATDRLYDYVDQHGTPSEWEIVNGVADRTPASESFFQ